MKIENYWVEFRWLFKCSSNQAGQFWLNIHPPNWFIKIPVVDIILMANELKIFPSNNSTNFTHLSSFRV